MTISAVVYYGGSMPKFVEMTGAERIALAKLQSAYTRKVTDLVARAVQKVMVENPPPDGSTGTGAAAFIQAGLETTYAIGLMCRVGPKTFSKIAAGVMASLLSRPPPPGIELIESEEEVVMLRETDGAQISVNEVEERASAPNDLRNWAKI